MTASLCRIKSDMLVKKSTVYNNNDSLSFDRTNADSPHLLDRLLIDFFWSPASFAGSNL